MEYKVHAQHSIVDLSEEITILLAEGWQLAGGVAVVENNGVAIYAQAIVRTAKKPKRSTSVDNSDQFKHEL